LGGNSFSDKPMGFNFFFFRQIFPLPQWRLENQWGRSNIFLSYSYFSFSE